MNDPLFNISYGLFVITACKDGRDNGCIADAFQQVTASPEQVSLCLNKADFTCDLIKATGRFTASIISERAKFDLFQTFGFQSGHNVDKFADFTAVKRLANGTLAITEGTNSYISVKVDRTIDLGTHLMFIGEVEEKGEFNSEPSMTYAYYRKNMRKPQPKAEEPAATNDTVWVCPICGYEYVGESVPDDFICPLCNEPGSSFVRK